MLISRKPRASAVRVIVTDLGPLVSDTRSAQARSVLCRAIAIPVLLLVSAANMLAAHPVAQLNGKTESAKDAVDRATGKALQGDVNSAVKILLDEPASEYSSEDMEWRSCMIDRFGRASKVVELSINDPWIAELAKTYLVYWRRSMTKAFDRVAAERELVNAVSRLAARPLRTNGDFDKVEEEIAIRAGAHGFHALLGVTAPFHELMLWRKQTVQDRQVHLPEGPYSVRVTLLEDFALRGWGFYATCGRRSTGGWATEEGLFAVVPAYTSLDDETFLVRFLAHETQHFADKHNFGKLEPWEMEYRAKLTELTQAVSTQDSTLQRICENRSQVKDSAHAYANFHVVRDLEQLLGPTRSNICGPSGHKGQALRDAAKVKLFADSEARKRSKPR